ncbi:50S ribosomal protein L17 [Geopsychrobacter electrodiphilus]|uniref:50S ribosomal protein L17 n=1 Tax=Geopsychrobacter electrodiphilus TaxID=225196 RepID=UPI000363278A
MRHNKIGRRLGRGPSHRAHMMANMMTSLFEFEKLSTTVTRAKELRRIAERMITLAKRGDLNSRRQVLKVIHDRKIVAKLFDTIAPRYQEREGGYTRIMRLNPRVGDNAPMSIIELVEAELTLKPKKAVTKIDQPKLAADVAPVVEKDVELTAEVSSEEEKAEG